jgi:hypothetical protein
VYFASIRMRLAHLHRGSALLGLCAAWTFVDASDQLDEAEQRLEAYNAKVGPNLPAGCSDYHRMGTGRCTCWQATSFVAKRPRLLPCLRNNCLHLCLPALQNWTR